MTWQHYIWMVLGVIGLFDIWIVTKGKESLSQWTERRWKRGVDIAIAVALIVLKTGVLGFIGGKLFSFDPVLFLLVGHMLLGHERSSKDMTKVPWNKYERYGVYACGSVLVALLVLSILR